MDKISELKFKLSEKYAFQVPFDGTNDFYDKKALVGFEKGFDAAMELQLPVKFAEWKDNNCRKLAFDSVFVLLKGYDPTTFTYEELYKYFLKNNYQPEL